MCATSRVYNEGSVRALSILRTGVTRADRAQFPECVLRRGPACGGRRRRQGGRLRAWRAGGGARAPGRGRQVAGSEFGGRGRATADRKSTRLNSSHLGISYAVFCL